MKQNDIYKNYLIPRTLSGMLPDWRIFACKLLF